MSEKREQIERTLGRFRIEVEDAGAPYFALDYDALAESKEVIIIECEVEHIMLGTEEPYHKGTYIYWHDVDKDANPGWIKIKGHHGTPGKALAIIL